MGMCRVLSFPPHQGVKFPTSSWHLQAELLDPQRM